MPENVIAVTGTNGKTTVSNMINNILTDNGYVPGDISALKITGILNHDDLNYIGEKLTGMTSLNIRDITITGNDDENVLVYINGETGLEEQIFILLQSDGGSLVI